MVIIQSPIGTLEVDATLGIVYAAENDVTEHPVEDGANVADHVRPRAETAQVQGIITDTPVNIDDREDLGSTRIADRLRATSALSLLRRIRSTGQLCTVSDSRRSLDNCVMTSLATPRDPSTGAAVAFTAMFKQIVTVESLTVQATASVQRVNGKKDLTKLSTTPTPEATSKKSLLKKAADTETGNSFLKALGLRD